MVELMAVSVLTAVILPASTGYLSNMYATVPESADASSRNHRFVCVLQVSERNTRQAIYRNGVSPPYTTFRCSCA